MRARVLMVGISTPAGSRNFSKTVQHQVRIEDIDPSVFSGRGSQLGRLRATHPAGLARFWGILPDHVNKRAAEEIKEGDQVWFHGFNEVRFISTVVTAFPNPALARALWGAKDDGRTWSHVLTVTAPFATTGMSKKEISRRVGYDEAFPWIGARLLTGTQSLRLVSSIRLTVGPHKAAELTLGRAA